MLVDARGLVKRYHRAPALDGIDLSVDAGEVVLLSGPNGAGKSTLLRALATLVPCAGTIRIDGLDAREDGPAARSRIGYVGHEPALYDALTVRENLRFFAGFHDVADADGRIDRLAGRLGLTDRLDERAGQLSRGLAQRASLVRALLPEPKVLLLDEPFTALDAASAASLEALLSERRDQGAILFSSHAGGPGERLATRRVALERGRIVP